MRYIMKFIFHYTRYTSVLDILDTSVRFREHFFQDSCRKSWVRYSCFGCKIQHLPSNSIQNEVTIPYREGKGGSEEPAV